MEETENITHALTTNGGPKADPSIVDMLKADLQELGESEEVLIAVVGYERSKLQARYHIPESGKELDTIARKVMREFKDSYSRNLTIAMDTMVHLCSGFFVQPEGAEKPLPLDSTDNPGVPVTFDETLASLLGFETGTARQLVRKLFGNNEMAILNHAEKLNRWLQNTKADLTTEFWQMGE